MEEEPSASGAETRRQILGIARGGGLNLLGQVCSQVAMLGVTVLLARRLGRDDLGRYAQAFAFLSLLGLLSLSGFRAGLTRFVAVHLAERDPGALRGTVRLGIALAATQGFRTMKPFALVGLVFEPLARVGGSAALLVAGAGLRGVMAALVASNLAAAVLAGAALRRLMRSAPATAAAVGPG